LSFVKKISNTYCNLVRFIGLVLGIIHRSDFIGDA
jgi:hypothetical protein